MPVLKFVKFIDDLLCRISPYGFAMARRVVAVKT